MVCRSDEVVDQAADDRAARRTCARVLRRALRRLLTQQRNSRRLRRRRDLVAVLAAANLQSNVVPTPPATEVLSLLLEHADSSFAAQSARGLCGGNRLFRSLDRGDTWTATIDLSKQIDRNTLPIMGVPGKDPMASKHDGYTGYGYVVTVAESPKLPGVLWVGTDDGNVQVSQDGGATWTNVSKNVPGIGETYHISRVEPSHFDAGTCYLAVDGHRLDDLKPYLFVTKRLRRDVDFDRQQSSEVGHGQRRSRRREEQRPAVCRH